MMTKQQVTALLFQALPIVGKDKKGRWYCVFKKGEGIGVSYFKTLPKRETRVQPSKRMFTLPPDLSLDTFRRNST